VRVAQLLPRSDSLIKPRVQVERLADSNAVRADAAGVGKAVRFLQIEAVERLGKFDRERIFTGPARAAQDHRLRKAVSGDRLAQVADRGFVAEEIAEAHEIRLAGEIAADK